MEILLSQFKHPIVLGVKGADSPIGIAILVCSM